MSEDESKSDFIRDAVREVLASGKYDKIITRFPPEPNGFLGIYHAKPICLSHGIAQEFGGEFNLRFDDTDPTKESMDFVEAIKEDIEWLGCDWENRLFFASDYFEQLYDLALVLVKKGKAYVCDLNAEEVREYRGTLTEPGKNSPYRDRSVEENLDLFTRMKDGEFADGSKTLRAKIDMSSPNVNMRDPVMYRILRETHYRRGNEWCIFPTYDFTHGQSDSIEKVSHSLCDVFFQDHRPLYDWFIRELEIFPSRQIEFARFNLTYCLVGKRHIRPLVEAGIVSGWDDPRLHTLRALRRRGVPPEAIRAFMERVGVTRRETTVEMELFEFYVRDHLNKVAPRVMGVINPLKVVITNYPEGEEETFEAVNNPEDESAGTRAVPFSRELYIERDDFMEEPVKKFRRLSPGVEVRLRAACYITCTDVVKDANGNITELHCTWDPESRGGSTPDGRKVRGTIHWVSAKHALPVEVRLYDRLFNDPNPGRHDDPVEALNPESLKVVPTAYVEPSLEGSEPGYTCQFERLGYFCVDQDSTESKLVINRTVTLRDTWARLQKK